MVLLVGCPIADRAWIVPRWMDCLAKQTVRPDGLVFIHSGWGPNDATAKALIVEAARHRFNLDLMHDPRPWHNRHDNERYRTLTDLRNRLLAKVQDLGADLFLSLDSDILLERDDVIERLIALMNQEGADLASPMTFLHPQGALINISPEVCYAYNAGWWRANTPRDEITGWIRPTPADLSIDWGGPTPVEIDIPMAVWLGDRKVIGCRYRWHPAGEDIGFAASLEEAGALCVWDTSLRVRHIWEEQILVHENLIAKGASDGDWVNSLEVQGA